jgi:hypothetical protein
MFDLEKSIEEWRRQMQAAGFKDPGLLAELESHLLDEVEAQMKSGVAAQDAFDKAVEHMGQARALKQEFKKIAGIKQLRAWMKHSALTFAGIPNQYVDDSMKTSNPVRIIEPGWATYLRAALFVAPAIFLLVLALVKVVPALKAVSVQAGGNSWPEFIRFNLGIAELFKDHIFHIAFGILILLLLLEWRAQSWPRYRRAVIGSTAFVLNLTVLISLFLIIVTGALVAQMAIQTAR